MFLNVGFCVGNSIPTINPSACYRYTVEVQIIFVNGFFLWFCPHYFFAGDAALLRSQARRELSRE
jgi:hypothetical protein